MTDTSPSPSGTVSLSEGGRLLATVPVENRWALSSLAFSAGTHVVTASYNGDSRYLPASQTANIVAEPYTYDAAFSAYVGTSCPPPGVCDTSYVGQPVTLWFAVMLTRFPPSADMGADGRIAPTGTVKFFDGQTLVASVALNDFETTYTTSALGVGVHPLSADYIGDENYSIYGVIGVTRFTVLPSPDPTRPPPAVPPPSKTRPNPFNVGPLPFGSAGSSGPGSNLSPTANGPRDTPKPSSAGVAISGPATTAAPTATASASEPGTAAGGPGNTPQGSAPSSSAASQSVPGAATTAQEPEMADLQASYRRQAYGMSRLWPSAAHGPGMSAWLSWLAVALLCMSGVVAWLVFRTQRARLTA